MPSDPTLDEQGGIYYLSWRDEELEIRVDRVHADKTGVYGEILIRSTAPNMAQHIHGPVHFNMIATATRASLVRHLQDVVPMDWAGILEQTCYKVVEQHRTGEPAIDIGAHGMPDVPGMRVDPILQEKQSTLFYGDGDSLKSFFATFISTLVLTGQTRAGLIPEVGNVLYLDYETDVDTFWHRVNMITQGLKRAPPDGLFYRTMLERLTDEFPRISELVRKHDIKLVVVDSAAPATLEPETADAVTGFYRALRALKCTSLVIAHQTKSAKGDYPFGSTFWRNLPRSNFHIQADRNQTDPVISLRHTKSNNGRRLPTQGYAFNFDEDTLTIEMASAADYPDLSHGVKNIDRIVHVLKDGAKSSSNILEMLNAGDVKPISINTLQVTLTKGHEDKRLSHYGAHWGILHQGQT
jgi:hypothetical protein